MIEWLNVNFVVDGIFLQLFFFVGFDEGLLLMVIDFEKDVDGLYIFNFGWLFKGELGLCSCIFVGVMVMLCSNGIDFVGKCVVVIGCSIFVGQLMVLMLQVVNVIVIIVYFCMVDLVVYICEVDIFVVVVGCFEFIGVEYVWLGVVVVDVGIYCKLEGGLCGDVCVVEVELIVVVFLFVFGGVGLMMVMMFLVNIVVVWCRCYNFDYDLDDFVF